MKYGRASNGDWVNVGYVKSLMSMGYSEEYIVMALRQTDNDMNLAIELLTTKTHILDTALQAALMEKSIEEAAVKDAPKSVRKKAKAAKRAKVEASERFREELGDSLGSTDEYLDLPLEEEAKYLEKYLQFLKYDGTS